MPYVEHFEALRATMLAGFPPVTGPARLLAALKLGGTLDFVQLLLSSAQALGGRLFEDAGARAWLYGSAMHGDVPPANAGSAISGVYLKILGHAVGWPSPEGGAGRLTDALAGVLRAHGGETRTGARVAQVLTQRARVSGVRTDGGDVVQARIVVCDTTPRGLLALAQDALPDAYVRRLLAFRYGPSTVKLDWALDGPCRGRRASPRTAGTVHVGGTADEITDALAASEPGRLPEHPFLLFGSSPSPIRPARPPGSTPRGPTPTSRAAWTGRGSASPSRRASRRRSSASRPASAT